MAKIQSRVQTRQVRLAMEEIGLLLDDLGSMRSLALLMILGWQLVMLLKQVSMQSLKTHFLPTYF